MSNVSKSLGILVTKSEEEMNREERRKVAKGEYTLAYEYDDFDEYDEFDFACQKSHYKHLVSKHNFENTFVFVGSYASIYYARMAYPVFESIYLENKKYFDELKTSYISPGFRKIILGKFSSKEAPNVLKVQVIINAALLSVLNDKPLPNGIGEKVTDAVAKITKLSDEAKAFSIGRDIINKSESQLPYQEIDIALFANVAAVALLNYYKGYHTEGDDTMGVYYATANINLLTNYYGLPGVIERACVPFLKNSRFDGNLALLKKCSSFFECFNRYTEISKDDIDYNNNKSIVYEVMMIILSLLGVGYDLKIAKKDVGLVLSLISDAKNMVDISETDCLIVLLFSIVCSELYNAKLQITEGLANKVEKEQVTVSSKKEEELKEQLDSLSNEILQKQQAISKRDSKIESLEAEIERLKLENKALSENNEFLANELGKLEETEEVSVPDVEEDEDISVVRSKLKDYSSKYKLVLVGGNPNLVSKLRETYPNITYVNDNGKTSMADAVITGCDVLMMKADSLGHPLTFRIRSLAKKGGKIIRYVVPVTNKETVERSILSCIRTEFGE